MDINRWFNMAAIGLRMPSVDKKTIEKRKEFYRFYKEIPVIKWLISKQDWIIMIY